MIKCLGREDQVAPEIEKPEAFVWIEMKHVGQLAPAGGQHIADADNAETPAAPEEAQQPESGGPTRTGHYLSIKRDHHAGAAQREQQPGGHVQNSRIASAYLPGNAKCHGQRLKIETGSRRIRGERQAIERRETVI